MRIAPHRRHSDVEADARPDRISDYGLLTNIYNQELRELVCCSIAIESSIVDEPFERRTPCFYQTV